MLEGRRCSTQKSKRNNTFFSIRRKIQVNRPNDQVITFGNELCIAEGFGRYHYQENIQFCRSSRGSLTELQDHLLIAFEEAYINDKKLEELRNDVSHCLKILNGYINYLKKQKQSTPG